MELVSTGLIVGILIGISGVGGGSIMTPVLMLVLGMNPLVAVGTDLLYSVPTKIFGAFLHDRQRTLDWKIIRTLLYGGIPGALAGIALLYGLRHLVDTHVLDIIVKRAVGIALFVAAASLMYSLLTKRAAALRPPGDGAMDERRKLPLALAGAIVGFFVSLTSIGSGAMTLPLLLLLAPAIGLRRLIGSDIAFAAFLIPIAAIGHASLGDINYKVALTLLVGSLPGVYVGSRLCKYLPEIWLRPAVAIVLVIAGTRLV
ncbi:MAG TPA: sulfite exporter TauE/SafE family protein [Candidatus Baltobacteraceae bacterium]